MFAARDAKLGRSTQAEDEHMCYKLFLAEIRQNAEKDVIKSILYNVIVFSSIQFKFIQV